MDPIQALTFLQLISEWMTLGQGIAALIKRAQAGETITDAEIAAARQEVKDAVAGWDAAAGITPV